MKNKAINFTFNKISVTPGFLALSLALGATPAQAALPLSWVRDLPLNEKSVAEEKAADLDTYLDSVDLLDSALSDSPTESGGSQLKARKKDWGLQSIKLELGVESGGKLGLVGLGGESALELIWTRQKQTPVAAPMGATRNLSGATLGEEESDSELLLSSDSTDAEIEKNVDETVAILARSGKVKALDRVRQNLRSKLLEARALIHDLAAAPESWAWRPYKTQLQLYVEAEGNVTPMVAGGVVSRLRIEWTLRKPQRLLTASTPRLASMERFVQGLEALAPLEKRERFRLNAVKAGVGLGGELELGAVEAKGSFLMSVFFRRAVIRPLVYAAPAADPQSERWLKAMNKGARIADALTTRAARHVVRQEAAARRPKFKLRAVEVEIEVTAEGGAFLPSVSRQSAVELFFYDGVAGGAS